LKKILNARRFMTIYTHEFLEECAAYTFRVEEQDKQETGK
jgi:hypothetical protein